MRSVEESEYFPRSQGGHEAVAVSSCCPSKQLKHTVRARFEITFGSFTSHVMQLVMPVNGAYSLRGLSRSLHHLHVVAAVSVLYRPAAQLVQTDAAAAENLPGVHCRQAFRVVAALFPEYLPASHHVQSDCPEFS